MSYDKTGKNVGMQGHDVRSRKKVAEKYRSTIRFSVHFKQEFNFSIKIFKVFEITFFRKKKFYNLFLAYVSEQSYKKFHRIFISSKNMFQVEPWRSK